MNLYFLLEGRRTEKKVYKNWLPYLLPGYSPVDAAAKATQKNYFLFSAEGYPNILDESIRAIEEIRTLQNFQFLILCLDADELTIAEREKEINDYLNQRKAQLDGFNLKVIIQNRTIETWFLGNRSIHKPSPEDEELRRFQQFYDVSKNDPERMGLFPGISLNAEFHLKYLKKMFFERGLSYSKANPGEVLQKHYLESLLKRISDFPDHLNSFQRLVSFCNQFR